MSALLCGQEASHRCSKCDQNQNFNIFNHTLSFNCVKQTKINPCLIYLVLWPFLRCLFLSVVLHVPLAADRPDIQGNLIVALIAFLVQMERSVTRQVANTCFQIFYTVKPKLFVPMPDLKYVSFNQEVWL